MADDDTLRFYAENAATYVRHASGLPSEQLVAFADALPPGSAVLELGTGSGKDAAYLLSRGHDVHPSDGSPELAAEAERLLGRTVRIMRFDQLEEDQAYDGVWASANLLHAPAHELTADLTRIHRALRTGGLVVASFKSGSGEGRDMFGRYYNYPDAETLVAHFRDAAAWADLSLSTHMGGGYDGKPTEWLWVTARR